VIINRQSIRDGKVWVAASLIATLTCLACYFIYYDRSVQGPRGGSIAGLIFGGLGTAFILIAFLISFRRMFRSWRGFGRAYQWLQAHVYLSLASYWIIILHAGGFHWGGPLTQVLMWTFTVCYVSGIIILVFQQLIPRLLLAEVPHETIYEQIDHVSRRNLIAADALVAENVDTVTVPSAAVATATATIAPGVDLQGFYQRRVRPYLAYDLPENPFSRAGALAAAVRRMFRIFNPAPPAAIEFNDFRRKVSEELVPVLDALEAYTNERRQFARQRRLQHVLHGGLLIHVPTAWVMVVLTIVHAIKAVSFL
jgi:hypothetical protein